MPYSMTDAEVKELFGAHGTVDAVRIVMDRDSGRPKGFAFVEMNNSSRYGWKDLLIICPNVSSAEPYGGP